MQIDKLFLRILSALTLLKCCAMIYKILFKLQENLQKCVLLADKKQKH